MTHQSPHSAYPWTNFLRVENIAGFISAKYKNKKITNGLRYNCCRKL